MKVKRISAAEKGIFNMYFRAPAVTPEPVHEKEDDEGFKEMLQQKKHDFVQGRIPYQKILKGEGWIYKIG